LSGDVLAQAALFCSRLPIAGGTPDAPGVDARVMADALPDRAPQVMDLLLRLEPGVAGLPAVMRHGDLWPGNLQVRRGRLQGVIDWDAWHPAAVPGTDLHQLFLGSRVRGRARPLSRLWVARATHSSAFLQPTRRYWHALGMRPTPEVLDAIAAACWMGWVANRIRRHPHLSRDEAWLRDHVDRVLPVLSARLGHHA
jgi:hypothetical protein